MPPARVAQALLVGGALACAHPLVPAWAALAAGMALALTVGNPLHALTRALTPRLLAAAVVGLGAGMPLSAVFRAGREGMLYTLVGLAGTLALGQLLRRALRIDADTSLLVSAGTAICGGSAIAALAPVLRPRDEALSVSLAVVFVWNAVALVLFPPLGHLFGMDEAAFGLWSALAIHDTSSVVGAASSFGTAALAVATPVKLARALWIVPLALGAQVLVYRSRAREGSARVRPPWFIAGFLGVAALGSVWPAGAPLLGALYAGSRRALVVVLFLVGANLSREALRRAGPGALLHGFALWACVSVVTAFAIVRGWIAVGG